LPLPVARPFAPRNAVILLTALVALTPAAKAQHPLRHFSDAVEMRFARSQPIINYTLRVDTADLSGYDVAMRVRNVADTFQIAMAKHPEYDDRYWRFIEGFRIEARNGAGSITRLDSALWRVNAPGGEVVIHYRLHLPPAPSFPRSAWRPFLARTGGLVGGPHSFLYLVGATLAPAHVTLELPAGWDAATGLESTSDVTTFFAPSAGVLVESPILIGHYRSWRFAIDGVPHRVVYWPLPNAVPFDTAALVGGIEQIARQAVALFGRAPWREYTFLLQDGSNGALEHANSVTVGVSSEGLARGVSGYFGEIAHEFFHAWNLMRIRPVEYRDVDYRPQEPAAGLWFSEGLSIFYADLLRRRAGLPAFWPTRVAHLEDLVSRYLSSPGNSRFSAEQVSRVAYNASPGALGDYDASTHLQGELIATLLDFTIRDATQGRRSMDDVMRAMLERYSGDRGFTGRDVEHTVADVCACNVTPVFDAYVRGHSPIDFDRYLRMAGLRLRVTHQAVSGRDSQPAADLRVRAYESPGEAGVRLLLFNPASIWGRAGFHTGDRLTSVNGAANPSVTDFRALLARLRIGDTVRIEVARPAGAHRATVVITGYERSVAHIEEIPDAPERQRAVRTAWEAGAASRK
jgi:predicted metalloprotease with PDZ domain